MGTRTRSGEGVMEPGSAASTTIMTESKRLAGLLCVLVCFICLILSVSAIFGLLCFNHKQHNHNKWLAVHIYDSSVYVSWTTEL